MKNIPIGELLKENGYITEQQLNEALAYQREHKDKRLGDVLVENGYITEKQKLTVLAKITESAVVDIGKYPIDIAAVEKVPQKLAEKYNLLAVKLNGRELTVVMDDPLNFYAIEDIRQLTGCDIKINLSDARSISDAIKYYYSDVRARIASRAANSSFDEGLEEIEVEDSDGDDAPIVKLLDSLLSRAYNRNASDIHIEPFEDKTLVRMRIEGILVNFVTIKHTAHSSLIARIKILSNLNIAQKRLPQDGHMVRHIGDKVINARVSIIPTVFGEKSVLRLLGTSVQIDYASHFGMNEENYGKFRRMLSSPNGIVYITGPTGSGKTTTLYMALESLSTRNSNISTIEDPVERNIQNVNQMQVDPVSGLTFDAGLRALLRQDPDIIMVGETRDAETASISVRAAITGHLVLSTLHTNSAAASIVRLVDMGLQPYLIASSMVGIVAQRLVGKVCTKCSHPDNPTAEEIAVFGENLDSVMRPEGCESCSRTGYGGRMAIHETLMVDNEIRRMILRGASAEDIEDYAVRQQGMKLLRESAKELVRQGVTTIRELEKVSYFADR